MLDHEKGALRILLVLERSNPGLIRKELAEELRHAGVGSSAMRASLKACVSLGLVDDFEMRDGAHYVVVSMLTERGLRVALKLLEVEELLVDL
jgi:hypothetical protein